MSRRGDHRTSAPNRPWRTRRASVKPPRKARWCPSVKELASADICVSVETYHPSVTSACLKAGAQVLNLTGSAASAKIFREVADFDAGVIICFVQGDHVRDVGDLDLGRDPIATLYEFFARQIEAATNAGVSRIWIDPGLGFYYRNLQDSGARIRHQMHIFLNSFRLRSLGWPVCHALPHAFECFEDEVRAAEPFFAVLALLGQRACSARTRWGKCAACGARWNWLGTLETCFQADSCR